jgi:monomeric sarcosine oxidase
VAHVAVVGAGVMGSATAWALRQRGADVTLYEQFALPHTRGSSHGRTRIFRLAYPEPHWVQLAEEALAGWRELERESRRTLLELHGLVELCSSIDLTSRDALASRGIEQRELGADELHERGVALPDGWAALLQPDGGIVRADHALEAFRGGMPVVMRRVRSLDELDADTVVVTAGSWVTELVPDVPVRVTRETVAYFRLDGPPVPSVVELDEASRHHAMYALHDPVYGLKAGAHHAGHAADPNVEEQADPALVERVVEWVRERFPGADPEPVVAETCLYTNTEDESFVLERDGRVVVGSPCSGHGFKFAPAIGRRLADLALR